MEDLIYGRNPILEYLRSGQQVNRITIAMGTQDQENINEIIKFCKEKSIPLNYTPRKNVDKVARGQNHQGVIAYIAPLSYKTLEEVIDIAKQRNEAPFLAVLDGIEDPHNLGAIIRTAEVSGAHGVVIPKRRASQVNSTVFKASAGAVSFLTIAREANINNVIEKLKKNEIWVVGLDAEAEQSYTQVDFKMPTAIVVGGEGGGLSHSVKKNCDLLISIPRKGQIKSLNASVSSAIVMYEVVRQRAN